MKQADAILINYPLMAPLSKRTKQNNLRLYANVTNPDGPAMTHSMFAIGWLDVGDPEQARVELEKNYENLKGPFRVWSELRSGEGATNFMTGAGGLLQTMLFGYAGLRLKGDGLHFKLQLPPSVTEWSVEGIKFMGNDLKMHVQSSSTSSLSCWIKLRTAGKRILGVQYGGTKSQLSIDHPVFACEGNVYLLENYDVPTVDYTDDVL